MKLLSGSCVRSPTGKEYYLIREVDPQNPESPVNWYLAEELVSPSIFKPNSTRNLLLKIWVDIRRRKTPYPELHVLNRVYYFESQTEGGYGNNKRKVSRITWDYWDAAHQWNLAIEALLNQELHVYSTKPVRPEKFSNFEKRLIYPEDRASSSTFPSRILQFWGAGCLVIMGLLMIIFG